MVVFDLIVWLVVVVLLCSLLYMLGCWLYFVRFLVCCLCCFLMVLGGCAGMWFAVCLN